MLHNAVSMRNIGRRKTVGEVPTHTQVSTESRERHDSVSGGEVVTTYTSPAEDVVSHYMSMLPLPEELQVFENKMMMKGALSFPKIYGQPLGRELLRRYCQRSEYSCMFDFSEKVQEYRTSSRYQRSSLAADIFPVYMQDESSKCLVTISLSEEAKTGVSARMDAKDYPADLFDAADAENHDYMEKEAFPAFVSRSHFYRAFIQWKWIESMPVTESDFTITRFLGKGSFGEVYECRKKDSGYMFAVKQFDKRQLGTSNRNTAYTERDLLGKINHRFVVGLKYAFKTKTHLCLVLDLMTGGNLAGHLKQAGHYEGTQLQLYAAEIACGLGHLHSHGILYRDLKPENILMDAAGHLKLSDMGLAVDISMTKSTVGCVGTPGFMSPQVVSLVNYDYSADWWSFGCVLYQLATGRHPLFACGEKLPPEELYNRTFEHDVDTLVPVLENTAGLELVLQLCKELLQKEPINRLGSRHGTETRYGFKANPTAADHKAPTGWRKDNKWFKRRKSTEEPAAEATRSFAGVLSMAWQQEMVASGIFDSVTKQMIEANRRHSTLERNPAHRRNSPTPAPSARKGSGESIGEKASSLGQSIAFLFTGGSASSRRSTMPG